jgi:hypothetical protein
MSYPVNIALKTRSDKAAFFIFFTTPRVNGLAGKT